LPVPNRRPQLEIVAPSASPEEAAAVVAAVQQFLRDRAPVVVTAPAGPAPWVRTALLEGAGAAAGRPVGAGSWGDPVSWGR
jgi:hypothetical protein